MKKLYFFTYMLLTIVGTTFSQNIKITGGIGITKGAIDADVLNEVIQQKQEEVFNRLFSNIVVGYFAKQNPTKGVYNFATYYSLFSLVSDITVGKSKTTVSKAVINSATELAYMYAFVKFCQNQQIATMKTPLFAAINFLSKRIDNVKIVSKVSEKGKLSKSEANLITLNFYLEAAYDVLARDQKIQSKFNFKRPITSSSVSVWYAALGLKNRSDYASMQFKDVTGSSTTLPVLISYMQGQTAAFLAYAASDPVIHAISHLSKNTNGIDQIAKADIDIIKLALVELANKTDYLFDQNVVKTLINLIVENTHFGYDATNHIDQVYVEVESLVLSIDKEFVSKNKKSSVSSRLWFINPRPFFSIGTSNGFFFDHSNKLNIENGSTTALKNINLASEKVGFRIKVLDKGYTKSFGPGEVYKFHGKNFVWDRPQKQPLVSSVYYNIYASGLLYNVLNLKTNKNFDYGYLASNIGVIFFNGLELSAGAGIVYKDGLNGKNSFMKIDFDIPIIDYLSALRLKNKK